METIAERLKSALVSLEAAANDAHRTSNSVQLLAVSKTKPVSDIALAYEAGQRRFGENYVLEGVKKIQTLQDLSDIEWHFIGPLQSNKTRPVAEHFDWVQSVDRLKIAQRLNDQRSAHKTLNVCIQVNINEEPQKSGVLPADLVDMASRIATMPNLTLRGLMALPRADQSEAELHQTFTRMHQMFERMQREHTQVDTLSMGMSADMATAVRAGSTMVRLGTAIFGPRNKTTQ